jgi:SecD/SecF fusion protein
MCNSLTFRPVLFVPPLLALVGLHLGCRAAVPSVVLEYEADLGGEESASPANKHKLIDVVNRRLGSVGTAQAMNGNKFKVEVAQDLSEAELRKIRRSIETVGDLQFRITARPDFTEHQEIIKAAQALPADMNELCVDDQNIAEWIPYEVREFGTVEQVDSRVVKRLVGEIPQALVLMNDGLDVTGEYFEKCDQALDELGQPQVNFKFGDQGAFRFGQLTSTYSPQGGKTYALAIIFNNKILTAPLIRSKITHQGRISGLRDMKEVDFIVSVLNAGSLPYPIRLVGEQSKFRTWRAE